ncbi:carbamoyltransferase family protein [Varunaivibrio sulfuroxidans]|uniref:Carbamoyltransferase n=1 Tax=Varunaivibrio sulfuroxidans TaxID=1773489 RepID=A0A4R3J402_9PROT|nr:carbamoyltransferase C-terminal domain-containing protein [Varunaivibrio sulfuroxidans]TCS60569.1 carbamoyltransferase [Varunaivibrio sulfuroxidans]WES30059.1 carbamoyltransferase C-terminal domain-containing protein [Varunaivibrio sulfuroxidans]
MYVLGLSFGMHDCAAALVEDGNVLWAIEEERLDRVKHSGAFPENSIAFVLERQNITLDDVDCVAFNFCPDIIQREIVERAAGAKFPHNFEYFRAMRHWRRSVEDGVTHHLRKRLAYTGNVIAVDHHMAHAASSYYCSPFADALILTIDGAGDRYSTAVWRAQDKDIAFVMGNRHPHSLGTLYSVVTAHLGLGDFAEGKTMGLASYGEEEFRELFDALIVAPPRSRHANAKSNFFELNDAYIRLPEGAWRIDRAFTDRALAIIGPPRPQDAPITKRHENIAASLQGAVERFICTRVADLGAEHRTRDVCLAGGVALNSVINGKLIADGYCDNLFVQPAAGDSGTALGSALFVSCQVHGAARPPAIRHVFWGAEFDDRAIIRALEAYDLAHTTANDPAGKAARLLGDNLIVGWFQGAMEFGPRALGHRSILANARHPGMNDRVNAEVKHREAFRPFAASVPEPDCAAYFTLPVPSPYMLMVCEVREGACLPAVTHVDNTARVQTLSEDIDPLFWRLHKEVEKHTGVPVLLNTSFNVKGEPLVHTPEDAIRCFLGTNLDALVIGNHIVTKNAGDVLPPKNPYRAARPFAPKAASTKETLNKVCDYTNYWATFVKLKFSPQGDGMENTTFHREL